MTTDDREPLPAWVRFGTWSLGAALVVAAAVRVFVSDSMGGASVLLFAGVLLVLAGPLMDRLKSFEVGPDRATAAFESVSISDEEVTEGKTTPAAEVLEDVAEEISLPRVASGNPELVELRGGRQIVLSDYARAQYEGLEPDEKLAVFAVMPHMIRFPNGGGKRVPGKDRFFFKDLDEHLKMIYRRMDRDSEDAAEGYAILNFIRPGNPLWDITAMAA